MTIRPKALRVIWPASPLAWTRQGYPTELTIARPQLGLDPPVNRSAGLASLAMTSGQSAGVNRRGLGRVARSSPALDSASCRWRFDR